ncbi:MAG: ribosomal subunit protein large subunit ribosomal protein [Candidatus Parcubacteria bacterium]|jgi:large subunit ribosomal protein L23
MTAKKTTQEEKKDTVLPKVILTPRITEKASLQSSANVYTFVVAKNATKHAVIAEIEKNYKVTPKAVNIVNMPRKNTFVRGKWGTTAGIKKAVVFLKKGDTIALS